MTSSITFETAALADTIKKAAKVAPSRGAAFDKAAGIVVEFDPSSPIPLAVVKATNLDIFMMEWVTVAEMSGEPARWRLPSALLALVVGSLPIGTGKTVTLESQDTEHSFIVTLKSGRVRAKFFPIDPEYYPEWGAFDPDEMITANDLGGRISQVAWAVSTTTPELAGICLDGEYAIATDRFRLVRVPLKIPQLEERLVIPSTALAQILRETGEVKIGKSENDNLLRIMPDDHTQMKSVVLDVKYPRLDKVFNYELPWRVKINRDAMLETIQRVNAFAQGDRIGGFYMYLGGGEIAFYMENEEIGSIGDAYELPGQMDHERFKWFFTAKNIIESLQKCPNQTLDICYDLRDLRLPIKFDDGAGYECWAMPRSVTKESSSA